MSKAAYKVTVGMYDIFILSLHSAVTLERNEDNNIAENGQGPQTSSKFTVYWPLVHYGLRYS